MSLSRDSEPEHAEPYWMQDVRCAQRAIDCERLASRRPAGAQSTEDVSGDKGSGSESGCA